MEPLLPSLAQERNGLESEREEYLVLRHCSAASVPLHSAVTSLKE